MFRKDEGRFSKKLGLLYIIVQYLGAILGTLCSYNLFYAKDVGGKPLTVTMNIDGDRLIIQGIVVEIIGTMIITFLYLTQTEEKTKMSSDPAITTLIIAATYVAVVAFGEES